MGCKGRRRRDRGHPSYPTLLNISLLTCYYYLVLYSVRNRAAPTPPPHPGDQPAHHCCSLQVQINFGEVFPAFNFFKGICLET